MDTSLPPELAPLRESIDALDDAVAALRGQLEICLHVGRDPVAALTLARGVAEQLAKQILENIGIKPPAMLDGCLREFEKPEVMSRGLVPQQIVTFLHPVRVWGNKSVHREMQVKPTPRHVKHFLESLLLVVDWYCYDFERGPKLRRDTAEAGTAAPRPAAGPRRCRVVGRRLLDVSLFRGRADKEKELGRLLAEDLPGLVSVLGRGGMGKTALACKVLRGLEQSRWPQGDGPAVDGVAYLSTRTGGVTLERLFLDGADLLGGDAAERLKKVWGGRDFGPADKVVRLLEALAGGFYVMLLDNLEDLTDADGRLTDAELAAFFQEWPRAPSGLRVLITSRVPLRMGPEADRRHRHVPLAEGLRLPEAVQLLRDLDPNGEHGVSTAPPEKLERVVRRAHGVPRALELLVSLLSPDNNTFVTLDEVVSDFYSQEEVVQQLVEENYRRLSPTDRRVAEALAVYRQPVPADAVSFLLEPFEPGLDVAAVLGRLVRTHLVRADRAAKTATLHPIDQEYLYQRLPEEGPYCRTVLHARAADHYATSRAGAGGGSVSLHSHIDTGVLAPWLAEFDHRVQAGQAERAAALLGDFGPVMAMRGSASRCRSMTRAVAGRVTDDRARLALLVCETALGVQLGPVAGALCAGEQARAAADRLDCPRSGAMIETLLGVGLRYVGDVRGAITHYERALELSRRCADTFWDSDRLLLELSLCHSYAGNVRQAVEYARQLGSLADQCGNPQMRMGAHNALSLAYFVWGRWDEAIRHGTEALSAWKDGMHDGKAYVLNLLGMSHYLVGAYPRAVALLHDGRTAAAELESPRAAGFCLFNLAVIHHLMGLAVEARPAAEEAQLLLAAADYRAASDTLLALLGSAAGDDRAAEVVALLDLARAVGGNPDLFPPAELAARAFILASVIDRDDLAEQARAFVDKIKAALVLPDE